MNNKLILIKSQYFVDLVKHIEETIKERLPDDCYLESDSFYKDSAAWRDFPILYTLDQAHFYDSHGDIVDRKYGFNYFLGISRAIYELGFVLTFDRDLHFSIYDCGRRIS